MPAVRTLPWLKARQSRVVPYEQVIALDVNPAPPPPTRPQSMAHVVSQSQQQPQPPLPYSHPSYQHYPPPVYPYPPPPHHHQQPYPHPQYPHQPPPYAHYPPNGYHPPAPPAAPPAQQPQPPPPTAGAGNPPPPAAGPPQQLQWQPPTAGTGNSPQQAQQEGDPPTTVAVRYNIEDDDTKLVRCALRWIFVRIPGVSHTAFWTGVAKSFERIRRRPYGTCKRRVEVLERTWRATFAARDAQGGLRGNNNTDLARAMRAWIAYRDDEEREKKEKEEDVKALDVRRRRLHELETERLGLQIGPQGIEKNERQPADGDDSNPILLDDEPNGEPLQQTVVDPLEDLEPPKSNDHPNAADQIAPIVELLRKRQREEREEADIRREEQILLNKRLAMMEEQVQMLSKLITRHNPPPASPSPQVEVGSNESAEIVDQLEAVADTGATSEAVDDIIVIDDAPAESALDEHKDTSLEPVTTEEPVDRDPGTCAVEGVRNITADEREGTSLEPGASTGTEGADVDETISNEAADIPADVPMGNSDESPKEPAGGLETTMSLGTTGTQADDSRKTDVVVTESPYADTSEAAETVTGATDQDQAMGTPRTTAATESE